MNLQAIQRPPLQPTEVIGNPNKRRLPDAEQNLHQNLTSIDTRLSGRTGGTYRIRIRAGSLTVRDEPHPTGTRCDTMAQNG